MSADDLPSIEEMEAEEEFIDRTILGDRYDNPGLVPGMVPVRSLSATLRVTKEQVEESLCGQLDDKLQAAGVAREDRVGWVRLACGQVVAHTYEAWLVAQP